MPFVKYLPGWPDRERYREAFGDWPAETHWIDALGLFVSLLRPGGPATDARRRLDTPNALQMLSPVTSWTPYTPLSCSLDIVDSLEQRAVVLRILSRKGWGFDSPRSHLNCGERGKGKREPDVSR